MLRLEKDGASCTCSIGCKDVSNVGHRADQQEDADRPAATNPAEQTEVSAFHTNWVFCNLILALLFRPLRFRGRTSRHGERVACAQPFTCNYRKCSAKQNMTSYTNEAKKLE